MNHEAIYKLYPNVIAVDDSRGAMDKDGKKVTIDQKLVDAWVDPNAYQELRATAYPTIEAQLDNIFHKGIEDWKSTIQKVKEKYPKGTT